MVNLHIKSRFFHEFMVFGSIFLSAIFLILGFYFFRDYIGCSKNPSAAGNRPEMVTKNAVKPPFETHREIKPNSKSFLYPEYVKRDPFRYQINGEAKMAQTIPKILEPLPLLKGVIWNPGKPMAILEDQNKKTFLVRVNEMVNSYKVSAIFPRSVVLEKDKERFELRIWHEDEKLKGTFSLK